MEWWEKSGGKIIIKEKNQKEKKRRKYVNYNLECQMSGFGVSIIELGI